LSANFMGKGGRPPTNFGVRKLQNARWLQKKDKTYDVMSVWSGFSVFVDSYIIASVNVLCSILQHGDRIMTIDHCDVTSPYL